MEQIENELSSLYWFKSLLSWFLLHSYLWHAYRHCASAMNKKSNEKIMCKAALNSALDKGLFQFEFASFPTAKCASKSKLLQHLNVEVLPYRRNALSHLKK